MAEERPIRPLGTAEALIDSFGEAVFRLSHNLQTRLGDPVRTKDFEAIEAQRAALGLSDGEIAERIGLSREQVIHIRNAMEWRHYEASHYERLNPLGGGRRYRADDLVTPGQLRSQHRAAQSLRQAMRFDAGRVGEYLAAGHWRAETLRSWLEGHGAASPDRRALIWADGALTYGELLAQVRRFAGALYGLGLRKGDVVSVQLPNLPEHVIAYLAIAHIGAVMTTLYMPHRVREMETLLGHSEARALIALAQAGDFRPCEAALSLADKLPALEHVISVGGPVEGALGFEALLAAGGAAEDAARGEAPVAADPFLLLYTSGTTARYFSKI